MRSTLIYFLLVFFPVFNAVADAGKKLIYTDDDVYMRFIEFSPEQIGAFYEGREFEKAAIDKLTASCYVTAIVKNKSDDFLWVDLSHWKIIKNGKLIPHRDIAYWEKQWDEINFKQAHRSTFSWTLLPQVVDLYPEEDVGGRLAIPMQSEPFDIEISFPTGKNKNKKMKTVIMKNMICKQNEK